MENDTDSISKITSPTVDSNNQQVPAEKPKVKARPLVEGINSPKTTNDVVKIKPALTVQEEKLISQDQDFKPESIKLMPASVAENSTKKNHHIGIWIMFGIILAALVFGGYQWYIWKLNKNILPIKTGYNHEEVTAPPDQDSQWPVATSTSVSQTATTTNSSATTTKPISQPPVATTTGQTNAVANNLKIGTTPTGFLNVRTSPSLSGNIIAKVYPGETYTYTALKSNWYQINLANNQSGWISGQYVTVIK